MLDYKNTEQNQTISYQTAALFSKRSHDSTFVSAVNVSICFTSAVNMSSISTCDFESLQT